MNGIDQRPLTDLRSREGKGARARTLEQSSEHMGAGLAHATLTHKPFPANPSSANKPDVDDGAAAALDHRRGERTDDGDEAEVIRLEQAPRRV
jgi:hypothetical protein